jgi:hypothetical protein
MTIANTSPAESVAGVGKSKRIQSVAGVTGMSAAATGLLVASPPRGRV